MNPADIKVGKYYTLQLLCIQNAEKVIVFVTASGDHIPMRQCDLECVTPTSSEPPTLVGPAPKHDPCRRFKKGDKVELKEAVDGRKLSEFVTGLTLGKIYTVEEDEKNHTVVIDSDNGLCRYCFVHFKLVTPVEELEPYLVEKSTDGATIVWTVKKRDCSQGLDFRFCPGWGGNIFFSENQCRKHAEAECDRLNTEYKRSRNEND